MIATSELILNPNGSLYHIHLKPENIAYDIIFVGDPDRVEKITKHFDSIEFTIQNREFKTQTGHYKNKRISVISTGIGSDNIDIVLNELDALVNIDLQTRQPKKEHTKLNIIRIGTSGSLQKNIPVDSFVISQYAIAFDTMLRSYLMDAFSEIAIENAFIQQTNWHTNKGKPCVIKASEALFQQFSSTKTQIGFTATANGFYAPQGRILRLNTADNKLNKKIENFDYQNLKITNLEMETAAIYGLGKLLGHNCISLNAILANRVTGAFSENPNNVIEDLIVYTLEKII